MALPRVKVEIFLFCVAPAAKQKNTTLTRGNAMFYHPGPMKRGKNATRQLLYD
jgi:aspartate carbamoyltransferase catalytic subunit